MKLKFIKAQEIDKNAKCTIHKDGKLGFSSAAIKKLSVGTSSSIRFATNEDDESDQNLYAVVEDGIKEDAFKVNKAGDYYYLNTRALFDNLGVDYKSKKVIYDIIEFEYEGMKLFKFIKRELSNKKKENMPKE